jgi:tetratricopeptide (TPR) repeat protein
MFRIVRFVAFRSPAPLRCAALLALVCAPLCLAAQHGTSCTVNRAEPTEGEIAYYRYDLQKASGLFAAAMTKDPTDSRSHQFVIDTLIAQGKLPEARKQLDAWAEKSPNDVYAVLAASELRHGEGDWLEAYALALKALKLNPCVPDAYADLADYEDLAGFHVTAAKHLALAHQLAPNDQLIRLAWIRTLSTSDEATEMKAFIADSKAVDDKNRKSFERQVNSLQSLSDATCQLASTSGPAVIPMVPIYGPGGIDSYGLEVAFNGHKRTLQIDTGASGFLLTQSAGGSLGLPTVEKERIGGFGGEGPSGAEIHRANSVLVGGLEFRDCPVEVLSNAGVLGGSHIEGNRVDTQDGLVGSDIFNRYLVTLDYIRHEIRLAPLPQMPGQANAPETLDALGGSNAAEWMRVDRVIDPSMKDWTQVYRSGHMLYIPVRISGKDKHGLPRLFVMDTGSDSNLIDTNFAKEITATETNPMMRFRGVSGVGGGVSQTGGFTMDFAGLELPVESMDAMDFSRSRGIGGFLGYPTLEQLVMHIDYRDNLVLFEAPQGKPAGR